MEKSLSFACCRAVGRSKFGQLQNEQYLSSHFTPNFSILIKIDIKYENGTPKKICVGRWDRRGGEGLPPSSNSTTLAAVEASRFIKMHHNLVVITDSVANGSVIWGSPKQTSINRCISSLGLAFKKKLQVISRIYIETGQIYCI